MAERIVLKNRLPQRVLVVDDTPVDKFAKHVPRIFFSPWMREIGECHDYHGVGFTPLSGVEVPPQKRTELGWGLDVRGAVVMTDNGTATYLAGKGVGISCEIVNPPPLVPLARLPDEEEPAQGGPVLWVSELTYDPTAAQGVPPKKGGEWEPPVDPGEFDYWEFLRRWLGPRRKPPPRSYPGPREVFE